MLNNLIIAGCLALLFLLLYWIRGRNRSGWLPLRLFKVRVLAYGFLFVLGEVYLMVLFADLRWPRPLLFLTIASWGVLLSPGRWNRHYQKDSAPEP